METSPNKPVTVKTEAGWHARMSSRLSGKGACACLFGRFPTSGFGRRSNWTEERRFVRISTFVIAGTVILGGAAAMGLADRGNHIRHPGGNAVAPTPIATPVTNPADKLYALQKERMKADELCRGSYDKREIADGCRRREAADKTLKRMGWCFEYSDPDVLPVDYTWHLCDVRNPRGDVDGPAAKPEPIAVDPDADFIVHEQERPKSATLAEYEKRLGKVMHRMAVAEMLWNCNLRTGSWFHDAYDMITADFGALRQYRAALNEEEFRQADRFGAVTKRFTVSWYMQDTKTNPKGCKAMASMPLGTRDDFLYR